VERLSLAPRVAHQPSTTAFLSKMFLVQDCILLVAIERTVFEVEVSFVDHLHFFRLPGGYFSLLLHLHHDRDLIGVDFFITRITLCIRVLAEGQPPRFDSLDRVLPLVGAGFFLRSSLNYAQRRSDFESDSKAYSK